MQFDCYSEKTARRMPFRHPAGRMFTAGVAWQPSIERDPMLRCTLSLLVLALAGAGCSGNPYKFAPVSGQVTMDGKALPGASVMFVLIAGSAGEGPQAPSSVGITDQEGRYTLMASTNKEQKGAVVGKHRVLIVQGTRDTDNDTKRTFHRQLPERYNRKSTLEREVEPEGSSAMDFALTSKP